MYRKVVAVWVSLLIMVSSIVILVEIADRVEAPTTLYVGGINPGNYSKIQWAIDNASDGDTVFVYNGTYYENVIVNKTINLNGERRDSTIINGSGSGNTIEVSVNFVNITGITVTGSGSETWDAGIKLNYVQNCKVFNSVLSNNSFGILLNYSDKNNITGNILSDNDAGIGFYFSNLNSITGNIASYNSYGMLIYSSNQNIITGNNAFYNGKGFVITQSNGNNITRNIASNNWWGFDLYYTDENSIVGNTASSNTQYGAILTSSDGNNITNNNASNNNRGIFLDSSSRNNITNNEASNNDYGIYLESSNGNNIKNNNASFNLRDGIHIMQSMYTNMVGNNASSNKWSGIYFQFSIWNNITSNMASFNNQFGIYIDFSSETSIIDNSMENDSIFIYGTSLEHWNSHNIDTSNTVNGKPVHYWKNQTGGKIPALAGQVILANCSDVTIENQEFTNGSVGIELGFSSNSTITGNNASSNSYYGLYSCYSNENDIKSNNTFYDNMVGIYLYSSNRNDIVGNNVSNNNWRGIDIFISDGNNIIGNKFSSNINGIYVGSSFDNYFYYNNFINNTNQASDGTNNGNQWDNGYPSGGNYWSDYTGIDLNSTPIQNVPPPDGIGDTPYVIDADSQDKFPLMEPYTSKIFENYTILKKGWNLISIPLIQTNQNLTKVLEMIDGYYDAVQWYDISDSNDSWKHNKLDKSFENDRFKLNETMSFWIHITQPGDTIFLYNGTQPTSNQTIQLHPGWNMVGYPSLTNHNRTAGLNNLTFDTHVDAIQWYDAVAKSWHFMGSDDNFVPGRGYWVHSKVEAEWEVPI